MRQILAALASFSFCTVLLVGTFYLEHELGRPNLGPFSTQWALVGAILGLWPQVVLSIVGFTCLHVRNKRRFSQYLKAGLVVGLLSLLLLSLEHGEWLGLDLASIIAANSIIGATLYWALGVRGAGPNNSFKPKPLRGSA
jgi:hypothetical protein